ncbi:MAG: oligosaccharide repeat unit polymerase [Candidatus Riflebacteria bacterium]|nr:oligosaccharide repeat unit polymerase [Candidatus Riflebacteria bacterium]
MGLLNGMSNSSTHWKNYSKLLIFFLLTILVLFAFLIHSARGEQEYQVAVFFLIMLALAIFGFFMLSKKLVLFEPVVLFSAYYSTVLIAGGYSIYNNFENNLFVQNSTFSQDIPTLMGHACMYLFFGYIFMLFGYYFVREKNLKVELCFETKAKISDTVVSVIILIFLSIGIFNFLYNVFIFAGGNAFNYMVNLSMRSYEFEHTGTTLGYLFAYNAMYLWFFKLLRHKKNWSFPFVLFLAATIVIQASTARIFSTISYITSFVGLFYFVEIRRKQLPSNSKYCFALLGLAVSGLLFYLLRIVSNRLITGQLIVSVAQELSSLLGLLGHFAVESGNLPNIGVFIKIIDAWDKDIGFLNGQSLISWVCNILPSSFNWVVLQPSYMIKEVWYSHLPGGLLPPTGVGEMYANFGFFGPFIGMFFFGSFSALLYNLTLKSKNFWVYIVSMQLSIGFIMLYPKGEFFNLSLWKILPILMTFLLLRLLSSVRCQQAGK